MRQSPSPRWFLAEGATGDYFDLFVLMANPTDTAATVDATYLLPDGTTVAIAAGEILAAYAEVTTGSGRRARRVQAEREIEQVQESPQ